MGKRFNSVYSGLRPDHPCGRRLHVGVMIGGARFVETTFGISFTTALLGFAIITAVYVIGGGLLAVIYTDAFQGAVMLVGMIILLVFTYMALGGFDAGNQALTDLASKVPATLAGAGHNGWTEMPDIGSSIWYKMITTIVLGVGIGVLAQPQLVVRFMTAKDGKALNRAVPIGGIFILADWHRLTVGALTNVYFNNNFGKIAIAYVPGGNVDLIMPAFINLALPGWFVVLFMITLLAAAMSTLSSQFHTMGTAFGHDLLKFTKGHTSITKNRPGNIVMFESARLGVIMLDSIMPGRRDVMGLALPPSRPRSPTAFSKNPSRKAAITGLVTGTVAWFLWTVFVHEAESGPIGICNMLFGTKALLGFPYTVIDPLVVAMPLSIVALAVVWLLTRHTQDAGETVEKVPV
jgi:SSS family solute:Na+ symporter